MVAPLVGFSPAIAEPTRRLTVKVDGVTLTHRFGVKDQDLLSDVGMGEFALLNDDAQRSLCTLGAEVSFELDGNPILWWTIKEFEPTVIGEGEEAAEITIYRGPTMSLRDAVVYPSTGVYTVTEPAYLAGLTVATKPFSDDRYLGWMEPQYDDSGWSSAVEVLTPTGPFRPEGFPDVGAQWIWHEAAVDNEHPLGSAYFRKSFTTVSALVFAVKIFVAGLDEYELYLDGVLIAKTDPATDTDAGQHARAITVEINGALPHTLAARVTHSIDGLGGFLCTVYEHKTDTVLVHTDDTWSAIDAADEPSMTPGAIELQLIDEAQDRGALAGVTCDFTAAVDSRGDDWPAIVGDFAVKVLDEYDMVLDQLAESYVEWAFLPENGGKELSMWIAPGVDAPGGPGVGRGSASGVTFAEGVNCTGLTHHGVDEIKNVGLIRWGDGFIEGSISASVTDNGRREAGVAISNVQSGPSALWTAYATLNPISELTNSVIIAIEPEDLTDEPYSAFTIGDTVTAPDATGTPTLYRVASISFTEDDDANLLWLIELGTARDLLEQRWQRWLRRTANGTLDGRSRSATPTSPSIINAGPVQVVEVTFSTGGGNEMLIGDRATPYHPREQLLFYRANIDAEVAGVTSDSSCEIVLNDVLGGESVTLPDSDVTGFTDLASPFLADTLDQVNVEGTAEGGHTGVTVTLLAVPTQ